MQPLYLGLGWSVDMGRQDELVEGQAGMADRCRAQQSNGYLLRATAQRCANRCLFVVMPCPLDRC